MFPLIGSLISAGSSLLGGLMNSSSQQAINAQNIAEQQNFAQNSIQWKVADAKKAGINPLAALGAQTSSFSNNVGSNALGDSVSAAGQDIGRAVAAQSTADDRLFQEQSRAQALQKGDLENAYLAAQIRTLNQPGNPPPMPKQDSAYLVPGQGPTVKVEPDKVTAGSTPEGIATAGAHPEVSFTRTGAGSYMPYPSKDFQGASFGSDLSSALWDVRHIVAPTFFQGASGDARGLPAPDPGKVWAFSPIHGYFQIPDIRGSGPWIPDSLSSWGRR